MRITHTQLKASTFCCCVSSLPHSFGMCVCACAHNALQWRWQRRITSFHWRWSLLPREASSGFLHAALSSVVALCCCLLPAAPAAASAPLSPGRSQQQTPLPLICRQTNNGPTAAPSRAALERGERKEGGKEYLLKAKHWIGGVQKI